MKAEIRHVKYICRGWPAGLARCADERHSVMGRSEPEGGTEGSQPPEGRAPQGTHTGHTQTISVYLCVCVCFVICIYMYVYLYI